MCCRQTNFSDCLQWSVATHVHGGDVGDVGDGVVVVVATAPKKVET